MIEDGSRGVSVVFSLSPLTMVNLCAIRPEGAGSHDQTFGLSAQGSFFGHLTAKKWLPNGATPAAVPDNPKDGGDHP